MAPNQLPSESLFPSIKDICFCHRYHFVAWVIAFAIAIRLFILFFTAWADTLEKQRSLFSENFRREYRKIVLGTHRDYYDLWITFFIGIGELVAYAVLFHFKQVTVIGAWLLLKTAASAAWKDWQTKKTAYTRFLLGNMLTILASFWLSGFVRS